MHNFRSLYSYLCQYPDKATGFIDEFQAELLAPPPPVDSDPEMNRFTVTLQIEADLALTYLAKRFGRAKSSFSGDVLEMFVLDMIRKLKLYQDPEFLSYLKSQSPDSFYFEVTK